MTRRRKLWSISPTAIDLIVAVLEMQPGILECRLAENDVIRVLARREFAELRVQFLRRVQNVIRLRLPGTGDLLQHLQKTRTAILAFRRPVSAAKKRLALRRD